MARSRARDDRGQKPGEDRGALRRPSDDGVPPASSVLRAPASDKPRGLRGIVEADETFILESFKGRRSDLPRKARKRGGTARHAGPSPGQHSHPRRPRPERRHLRSGPASGRRRFGRGRPRRPRHAWQSSHRRRRQGDRRFRPQSRDSVPGRAVAGKAYARGPHLHINNVNAYHGRLKQWLNRFNGVATKNLPNHLGKRSRQEDALGTTGVERVAVKAVPIARAAKSSAGATRTAFCGLAAKLAGARSTR